MAESAKLYRRQVAFRIGPEDEPLLAAAAREHGGIQAGILAALRAHAAQRLQAALEPAARAAEVDRQPRTAPRADSKRRKRGAETPAVDDDLPVELNVRDAAQVLGISAAGLRAEMKRGARPGRRSEQGFYLAQLGRKQLRQSGIELTLRGASEVTGLRPGTLRARCKSGRYRGAHHDGAGWRIPAAELV